MIELIIGAVLLSLLIYGIFIEPHLMKVRHVKNRSKTKFKKLLILPIPTLLGTRLVVVLKNLLEILLMNSQI